jgi:hypothetical protein
MPYALWSQASAQRSNPGRVELLQSVGGLSPEVVGTFRDPIGFQRATDGRSFVFDRRGHAVYRIDADGVSRKIVEIGGEEGRVIEPTAFSLADDGSFVVADAPNNRERVQSFNANGTRMSGFLLPGKATARVVLGTLSLSGVGTIAYTGSTVVMSQPESGWLMAEYSLTGFPVKTAGHCVRRATRVTVRCISRSTPASRYPNPTAGSTTCSSPARLRSESTMRMAS